MNKLAPMGMHPPIAVGWRTTHYSLAPRARGCTRSFPAQMVCSRGEIPPHGRGQTVTPCKLPIRAAAPNTPR